jgi:hypothetical protein|tara:strand:+ start:578 stop:730 length:153 start_codon:yes stop_codon:yes gene_type:complete
MYSYLFGKYFYKLEIEKMIDEIEGDRKKLRLLGETMSTSFAQDLKLKLNL